MTVLAFDVAVNRWHSDKLTGEQPHVIRIAWWLDGQEPTCRFINPTFFSPATAIAIDVSTLPYHGLTVGDLLRDGEDPAGVIGDLEKAAAEATTIATFNSDFHWRHLYRLMGVAGAKPPASAVDVMAMATPILAIPAMRPGGGLKSPSLREACQHFDLPAPEVAGATPRHIALSTVQAVRMVYDDCLAGSPS